MRCAARKRDQDDGQDTADGVSGPNFPPQLCARLIGIAPMWGRVEHKVTQKSERHGKRWLA